MNDNNRNNLTQFKRKCLGVPQKMLQELSKLENIDDAVVIIKHSDGSFTFHSSEPEPSKVNYYLDLFKQSLMSIIKFDNGR